MPPYLIISDVHANLEALEAALENTRKNRLQGILFLGDSVGYGPDPNECTRLLKEQCTVMLAGNHDWAAIGLTDIRYFNPYAREAIEWTGGVLTDRHKAFLKKLPLTTELTGDDICLVHGTPKAPEEWHYLSGGMEVLMNFHYFKEKVCFVGHSHVPGIFEQSPDRTIRSHRNSASIKKDNRYIINAGSVGQPRDGNPDAAYTIMDEDSITIHRVPYDIESTQRKMKKADLPAFLINRLSMGR